MLIRSSIIIFMKRLFTAQFQIAELLVEFVNKNNIEKSDIICIFLNASRWFQVFYFSHKEYETSGDRPE